MSTSLQQQTTHGVRDSFFDRMCTLGDGQWVIVWKILEYLTRRETLNFVMATMPAYERSVHNKSVYSFLQHIPKHMYTMRSLDTTLSDTRLAVRMDTGSVLLYDNLQSRRNDDLEDLVPVEVDIHVEDVNSSEHLTLTSLSWRVVNLYVTTGATAHVANFKNSACWLFSRAELAGTDLCPVTHFISQLTACMINVEQTTIPADTVCDFDFSAATNLRMLTVKFPSVKRLRDDAAHRYIHPNDIDASGARNLKILVYAGNTRLNPMDGSIAEVDGSLLPHTLEQLTVSNLLVKGQFFTPEKPAKHVQIVRCEFAPQTCVYTDTLRVRGRPLACAATFNAAMNASTRHSTKLKLEGATFTHVLSSPFDLASEAGLAVFSNLTVLELRHVLVSQELVNASCNGHPVKSLTIDGCRLHSHCKRIVQIPSTVETVSVCDSHEGFSGVDVASVLNAAKPHQSMRFARVAAILTHAVHGDIVFDGFSLHCLNMMFVGACVLRCKRVVMDKVEGNQMDFSEAAEVVLLGINPTTFGDLELLPHVFVTIDGEAAVRYLTQCFKTHSREAIRFMVSIVLGTVNHNPLQHYFEALLAATACNECGQNIDKVLWPFHNSLLSSGYVLALHAMYGKQWDTYAELLENVRMPADYRWSTRIYNTDRRTGKTEVHVLECIAFNKLEMYNRGRRQHSQRISLRALERENAALKLQLKHAVELGSQGERKRKRATQETSEGGKK